jgi:hypothetical protein
VSDTEDAEEEDAADMLLTALEECREDEADEEDTLLAHTPQSVGQLVQLSLDSQIASPQVGAVQHVPQSCEQVPHVSPPLQIPSPQADAIETAEEVVVVEEERAEDELLLTTQMLQGEVGKSTQTSPSVAQ